MRYVNLGRTGLRVSRVCLGMMSFGNDSERPWVIDETAAEPIVKAAVDGGVTFFDTADTYSGGASEVATAAGREAADSIDDAFARFDAGVSGATSVV
jgi:1-deoxyxylulose-5-phosphate synthase